MATNTLIISHLNPIKFVTEGYVLPDIYNVKDMDQFRYQDTVPDFYEQRNYFQPWQSSDIIFMQFLSNYGQLNLKLMSCKGDVIASFAPDYVPTSIEATGMKVYQASIALNSYPEGNYYFKLEA